MKTDKIKKGIQQLFQRRYLLQLTVTCGVFVLIPCTLSLYFTMYHSFKKLQEESQEYYLSSAKNYFDYFLEEIGSLTDISLQISTDSRKSSKPAYSFNYDILSASPYYYYEAVSAVSFYRNNSSAALAGIYYPGEDWIITDSHKYTLETYIANELMSGGQKVQQEKLYQFLMNSIENKMSMHYLQPSPGYTGSVMMTVCTYIGLERTPVVFLYHLNDTYLQSTFWESAKAAGLQFMVFAGDTQEPILSVGSRNVTPSSIELDFTPFEKINGKRFTLKQEGEEYAGFFAYNDTMKYYYGVVGASDAIYRTGLNYFKTMQWVVWGIFVVLLGMLVVLVYINYKPINELIHKVQRHTGEEGIGSISGAIDFMTDELNELNILLKDYLLENILRGKPVNKTILNRLGISGHHGDYRIYALYELTLNTEGRLTLTEEMLGRFEVPAFITDIFMRNITVIICLIPANDGTGATEYIRSWVGEHYPDVTVYEGDIVHSINDLRASYLSCNIPEKTDGKKRQESKNAQADEQAIQMAQEILEYLQQNFCDPCLSQASVADQFNISTYTLSRLFKNQFGIGFAEFISSQRMEYAKQLLLTTDSSIGDIAQQVGLPNLNYFSRVFKAAMGVPPTQYRASQEEQDSFSNNIL